MPIAFKGTAIMSIRLWRNSVKSALLANVVLFFIITLIFYFSYGFIADDINYFYYPPTFTNNNLLQFKGNELLWFIGRSLRTYFKFDLPACHILFAAMGFIGSLNFLHIIINRSDFTLKSLYSQNRIAFWTMLCFPNFVAWGRFFGKDSLMFFLASIFARSAYQLLVSKKSNPWYLFGIIIPLFFINEVRPHVAGALTIALLLAYIFRLRNLKVTSNVGLAGLVKIYLPLIAIGIALLAAYMTVVRLTGKQEVDIESTQQALISASRMGSYGGSRTTLAEELKEDPRLIFSPLQVSINVANLLFAPMPWKMRGIKDIVALSSNLILIVLLVRFRRNIRISDTFSQYCLFSLLFLSGILSFMAGNVGLMLRQKTVILPFLFMLLFARKSSSEMAK